WRSSSTGWSTSPTSRTISPSSSGPSWPWPGRARNRGRPRMAERVSAAILNWNGGELVLKCARTLLDQTLPPVELIIIDNASTDGSLERLRAEHPAAQVITNQQNLGFARAANQAVAAATGTWLLLANLDVELERDYVARLVAAGTRGPRGHSTSASSPTSRTSTWTGGRAGWAGRRGTSRRSRGTTAAPPRRAGPR